jgi:alpha-tubulin suppressor-like RCC1 family protein
MHRGVWVSVALAFLCVSIPARARAGNVWGLVVGDGETCSVTKLGDMWCAGRNNAGQLGDGTTLDAIVPKRVAQFVYMGAAGDDDVCYTMQSSDNRLCSGANAHGQIGDGTTTERHGFTGAVTEHGFWISAGETTCKYNSGVWCWGSNQYGAVGDGTTTDRTAPVLVGTDFVLVETSGRGLRTCAMRRTTAQTGYSLWCWGDNTNDALGVGPGLGPTSTVPVQVTALGDQMRASGYSLSVGTGHACAVKVDGTLWCWGRNDHGQLGDGTTNGSSVPVPVVGLDGPVRAVGVSRYGAFTCASTDTNVWCWGQNDRGQLGDGTSVDHALPAPVLPTVGSTVSYPSNEVRSGRDYACSLNGCWGANDHGQLGDGTVIERHRPVSFLIGAVPVPWARPWAVALVTAALAALGALTLKSRARSAPEGRS